MVDFGNETTIATAPKNIVDIIVIQFWYEAVVMFSSYQDNENLQVHRIPLLKKHLYQLFYVVLGSLEGLKDKQDNKNVLFDEVARDIDSDDFEVLNDVFKKLSLFLYKKGIIKWDVKKPLHPFNIEIRNRQVLDGSDY